MLGGPMNMEEMKMNKELLKEVSAMKKKAGTSHKAESPNKSVDRNIDIEV
jgi:hypothetical protein